MQRQVACNRDQIEWRNIGRNSKRTYNTIADCRHLRPLDVAESEDVFIDEALLRQGAEELERAGVHDIGIAIDCMLQQSAADGSQQTLEIEIADDLGLQQRQQQRLAGDRTCPLRPKQFGETQLPWPRRVEAPQQGGDDSAPPDQHFGIAQS